MIKLEFLPEPYMLFRLGKLPFKCFVDPYERFFMLFKSRSRTHHPHMHYPYTEGRSKNMPSI
jgi:hypothetical protein